MFLPYLAFESPSLDLDITLLIQTGIFVLLFLFLKKFVIDPYLEAYDSRESLTRGARNEAESLQKQAREAVAEYESSRQAVYTELMAEHKKTIAEVTEEASAKIAETHARVQQDVSAKQAVLDKELAQARRDMDPEIEAISAQIAQKILV